MGKGKNLQHLLPTHLCPVEAASFCLDYHFPSDICRVLGVGKIPVVEKGNSALEPVKEDLNLA